MVPTNIVSYKNIHSGRVFLIGNGSSLSNTPLDNMVDEYSIAMNRISRIYCSTIWRPSYYICVTTAIVATEDKDDFMCSVNLDIPTFICVSFKQHFEGRSNLIGMKCSHGNEKGYHANSDWWSWDLSKRVCKYGSSLLVAAQLAVYMGFHEIVLVGCDMGYVTFDTVGKDPNHFDPEYSRLPYAIIKSQELADNLNAWCIAVHDLIKRSCKAAHVSVVNATVGGFLDIYPRVDINKLLLNTEN